MRSDTRVTDFELFAGLSEVHGRWVLVASADS